MLLGPIQLIFSLFQLHDDLIIVCIFLFGEKETGQPWTKFLIDFFAFYLFVWRDFFLSLSLSPLVFGRLIFNTRDFFRWAKLN